MAPLPEDKVTHVAPECHLQEKPLPGDEVVISGISGKFPESESVRDFMHNLYNKVDMVSDDQRRWAVDHPDIPISTGKVKIIDKFDAQFFGVHYKQAWCMDPQARMLLENTYGALIDAGINPRDLRNTNTAVYIGVATSDAEKMWYYEKTQISGLGLVGTARSMISNRISYWLGAQGPSYTINTTCSSTLHVVEHAYNTIRSGQSDMAIIGGANLCAHPFISLLLSRMGLLSEDGRTRCFDSNANGYGRAEAISMIILQKAKHAKRAYAQVVHAKSNCEGFNSDRVTYPDKETQRAFLEGFYSEVDVLPAQVQYIEAFGAGIKEIDKNELDAIDEVFCKGRTDPLLVGCVKSNMGHAEAASGAIAVTKLCLAYHKGVIAPNIHYSEPREDVAGVREGRIRVVTEPTPFPGGYTAASSYSFSGVNVHVLFKGLAHNKNEGKSDDLPRLVTVSGRSEENLAVIFGELESQPVNYEQLSLLHNIHEVPIPGHVVRGYNILKTTDGETVSLAQDVDYFPGLKRPVWFVYSGMGSQWSGMATQLMRIPIFAAAIERCCQILAPKGVDLLHIVTDPDPRMYDNILHSFVGIAAVQIGLTDLLTALGIQPDNIIGHSVGELGCAYADGCFTAEEMILSAYHRGLVSLETPLIRGSMAAVGLSFDEVQPMCPPEIEVACHNGPGSSTISGPADATKKFVAELMAKGIFAKEVPTSNIAYHSSYIAGAGPGLLKYLKEVIKEPKLRSPRWLSTSLPQNKWDQPSAKYSSAEYHTNNLLSPVLFEETSRQIPPNAITIEVAPHGLLQAILRRSLAADCVNVPLTKRGHNDNVQFFLDAVGKLFIAGLTPKIGNIYPAVQYPVSASTPVLSHLVGWEHSEEWHNHLYYPKLRIKTGERHFLMSICDDEYKFIAGNIINGVNRFPAAGYLVLAWETLAMMLGVHYSRLSVVFEGVRFESDAVVRPDSTLELIVMLQKATGKFEITAEGGVVASGRIYTVKSATLLSRDLEDVADDDLGKVTLSTDEVYRIMSSKGYSYKGEFRSIQSANISGNKGQIKFNDNWVTFLDAILQMNVLKRPSRGVSKPRLIESLKINVDALLRKATSEDDEKMQCLDVTIYDLYDRTRCRGVELKGLVVTELAPCTPEPPLLETYTFVPYFGTEVLEEKDSLSHCVQLAVQNTVADVFNVTVVMEEHDKGTSIARVITKILHDDIQIRHTVNTLSSLNNKGASLKSNDEVAKANLLILTDICKEINILEELYSCLDDSSFILSREKFSPKKHLLYEKWHVVGVSACGAESIVLLKKRAAADCRKSKKYITVKSNNKFPWVELVQAEWRTCDSLVLVSECDPCAGLLGLFNCLRREPEGHVLSLLLISDCSAPAFRPDVKLYQEQLDKNMAHNIYRNGQWGSYQYQPLQPVSVQSEHVYLASQRPEDISSLAWLEGPLTLDNKPLDSSKKIVQVYYSAVINSDVQRATGRMRLENTELSEETNRYGMDFCGRTSTGDRVMGLLPTGALSSLVEADVDMLWPVPPHWSMEDAVTVPMAYANIFYCLEIIAQYPNSDTSVLIHNGSEALGQAAISVCLAMGANVYTTVESKEAKEWILKTFPDLKENNVNSMKDGSFEDMVMAGTKGEGLDLIISTLAGKLHNVSLRCMGFGCEFVNLNYEDMRDNSSLGMYIFRNGTYRAANIKYIFRQELMSIKKRIQHLVAAGIAKGYVQPLSRVVFGASEASRAFRFTSTGRHVGKVLLKLRDEELRPLVTPERALLPAQPQLFCFENESYVVITGPKETGFEVIEWLVQRGAKNLLLHLQEQTNSGYQAFRIRSWRRRGVNVQLSSESLQTEAGCLQLLTDAAKQAPVLGLFVAPRAGHRGLFHNAKPEHFAKDFSDKALAVVNLDSATRKLCPQLKQFVVFTSAAVGRGAAGCSSISLADSVLERICEERGKLGLPALALQWGAETHEAVLSALDQLLASKQCVAAMTYVPRGHKYPPQILNAISAIMGIADPKELNDHYTLERCSVDISSAREIQSVLEKDFQVFCNPDRILNFTIAELKELEAKLGEKTTGISEGLGAFFSYVDPVEFNAGDPIVRMPSLLSDGFETEEETYEKDTCLILIPGMESHENIFLTITKRLKLNAFTCQLEFDDLFEDSIKNMAAKMSQVILKTLLKPDAKFLLLGYSFGVTVALEVAAHLEKLGYVGQVFCLDGSPRWFAALLEAQLGHLNKEQLQDEVIKHMFRVMTASGCNGGGGNGGKDVEEALKRALAAENDWERKLDVYMRHLRGRVKFSFQYQRSLVAMVHARIRQARAYSDAHLLSRPLRSELILLKATRRPPSLSSFVTEELGRDYGLSAYSHQPLKVYELDCDHASAPFDLNVSNILNEHVADLEEFKKLNLCDTYIFDTSV